MDTIARAKKTAAALLAAALVILSPGLGCYEALAAVAKTQAVEAPVAAVPAGLGASGVSGASVLGNAGLSIALSPASLSQLPAGHPAVGASAVTASAIQIRALKAAPVIPTLPQAAAVVAAAEAPVLAAPQAEKPASPIASLQAGQENLSGVLSDRKASGEKASTTAAMPFDGSRTGAMDSDVRADAVPMADVPGAARKTSTALKRAMVNAAGGTATGFAFIGIQHAADTGAIAFPAWRQVLDFIGSAGYYVGNAISFVFAIPQVLKTFQDGHHGSTPVKRALIGTFASLALGLISAPLAGQLFWGVQNIFGGLTMAAPMIIGKVLARFDIHLSGAGAYAATAAASAALLAVSFGLYAAASALMPALLPMLLGKAGISVLTLAIQVATGAAFLALFTPDIGKILKKQAPEGFTPTFSLFFAVASIGFVAWTVQRAIGAPHNSPDQIRYIIYAAQNILYAIVAMFSYVHGRRHAEAKKRA